MSVPKLRFKADDGSDFPEWETTTLGEHGQVQMCRRIFKEQTSEQGDIPFYKIGTFGESPDSFISRELFEDYKNKYPYPEKGNILISASGSIGRAVEYTGNDEYFQDSNIVWLSHDEKILDGFLKQFYSNVRWGGLEGSTIKRLYNKIILRTEIRLPQIDEQQKISDLFSSIDQIIEQTQSEIDAWEKQKRGVMQLLFSQKMRFKADDGSEFPAWEDMRLGDAGYFYGGLSGKNKNDFGHGNSEYITYRNIFANTFAKPDILEEVEISCNEKQNIVQYGDVLFTQSSETFEELGLSSVWIYETTPFLNSFCFGWRPVFLDQFIPEYLGYFFRSKDVRRQIIYQGQGISRINLAASRMSNIIISIPCLEEQRKIAACLSAFDAVIDKTKQELAAYRELKKGLLQQMFV